MHEDDHKVTDEPTQVGPERSRFDHFADKATGVVSHGPFFVAVVGLMVVWAVVGAFIGFSSGWANVVNVPAGVLTLLMVALLENEERRSEQAIHRKLNAVLDALADLAEKTDVDRSSVDQLRAAVALSSGRAPLARAGERGLESVTG
ncbi:MAG: low affinity iron permease family protein [Actinomycetota bacterium]|nr:low affinity iron permease family protein [Actinomycetota bacterium]